MLTHEIQFSPLNFSELDNLPPIVFEGFASQSLNADTEFTPDEMLGFDIVPHTDTVPFDDSDDSPMIFESWT